jgi:general secretion pathway protein G
VLVQGVVDAKSPDGVHKLYFLRRLPRDPFADPSLPAERSWAPRCHDSPPQAPRPGPDVFDVASMSDGIALDGSRYADW